MRTRLYTAVVVIALGTASGCRSGPLPAFTLEDINPLSDRYGEAVSPNDYAKQVTGWYFIHAT